ncbi:MAG: AAA family ATPase [Planctomycetes bacterium]|nr:AAA family ATPase [Planctomycetota bacterium]
MAFWGRTKELERLGRLLKKESSSLVVCKGRRRIGKSTLIAKFAESADRFLQFQGLAPRDGLSDQAQRDAFSKQLARQSELPELKLESWAQTFSLLASNIKNEKTVVLLDEISWMGMRSRDFAGYLKIAWDTEFKKHPNLILVLCGSVSSWIENNIMKNTGFVGRVSLELQLEEMSLAECHLFWKDRKDRISSREKLKLLAVTGGIPRYLEEVDPSMDADHNIKEMCFLPDGLLYREFQQIFDDIFSKKTEVYRHIIKELVSGDKTLSDISQSIEITRGGRLSAHLEDLIVSGFLMKYKVFKPGAHTASRSERYRLKDNYLRFYFRYMEKLSSNIESRLYEDSALSEIISWDSIVGIQFETLVLNNLSSLCRHLNIPIGEIISCSPYHQKKTKQHPACQIDLLIQTKECLYICEIKFKKSIGIEVIDEVNNKIKALTPHKGLSLRIVLVYEGKITQGLDRSQFFDQMLSFEKLIQA